MFNLIIIPAYNEAEALPSTLETLKGLHKGFEILVVNDGSTDETSAVAAEAAKSSRIPIHRIDLPVNCGIGVAVQTGYLFAVKKERYRYVIQFDADGQHDAACIPELVRECDQKQLDLCVGSRFLATL